jgi:hypothetical protein
MLIVLEGLGCQVEPAQPGMNASLFLWDIRQIIDIFGCFDAKSLKVGNMTVSELYICLPSVLSSMCLTGSD